MNIGLNACPEQSSVVCLDCLVGFSGNCISFGFYSHYFCLLRGFINGVMFSWYIGCQWILHGSSILGIVFPSIWVTQCGCLSASLLLSVVLIFHIVILFLFQGALFCIQKNYPDENQLFRTLVGCGGLGN